MKKLLSTVLALVMLVTSMGLMPFSAQAAGRYKNIELEITASENSHNGLVVGGAFKSPDGIFSVKCLDNNGYEWETLPSPYVTYWAEGDTKMTYSDTVQKNKAYILHLAVCPLDDALCENDVDIDDVKSIKLNGVELKDTQYRRGELGTSIYITAKFYYADVTGATGSGYYFPGETVTVTADKVPDGKHVAWSGSYITAKRGKNGKLTFVTVPFNSFKDKYASTTTFTMIGKSQFKINPLYEDHTWNDGVVTKKATCLAEGVKTYTCTKCGETKTEAIGKVSHTYKTYTTKASVGKNGSVITKCAVCGAVKSKSTIYAPKTVTLAATSYTYSGKSIKPAVKVVDATGKVISASNYTVKYSSNKYVGTAKVTITFKGNYSGTITKTFKINPKNTSISSLTAGSKKFTVKWKKYTTQTTGYQIQYSTKSSFSGAKTVTASKNSTTSKTVSKLKSKKKYYVRIRTYKVVDGTKYYSAWSSAKKVTTKK